MYINLGYIKSQIKLRKVLPNRLENSVGSILKHHRLKEKLTLEDGSEGICSISYLSKVENSLIKPADKYIALFEKKYNIDLRQDGEEVNESINLFIEQHFYQSFELMDEYQFEFDDYRNNLNYLAYLIGQESFSKAHITYSNLNPYIKNFNSLELYFYLYLTSKLLSVDGRVKDGFDVLFFAEDTGDENPSELLVFLIDKEKLTLATYMHKHSYISINYDKLYQKLIQNEHYHLVHEIKFVNLFYLANYLDTKQLNIRLKETKHIEQSQINLIWARHYYHQMEYEKSYSYLKDKAHLNLWYYTLACLVANRLNDKKELTKIIQINSLNLPLHMSLIKSYLSVKLKADEAALIHYIQTQIMKVHDLPDVVLYLKFWYEEANRYFKHLGYYKDASTFGQLIFKKIEDLTMNFD